MNIDDQPPPLTAERALNWSQDHGLSARIQAGLEVELKKRRGRRTKVAASALALCLIGFGSWAFLRHSAPAAIPYAATIVSSPETRILDDGSRIELRDGARIDVHYTATRRDVTLLYGGAYFQVSHNPLWPFVVTAAGVETRAVGTAFTVQLTTNAVEVVVSEGRVAVANGSAPSVEPTFVAAGRSVFVELTSLKPAAVQVLTPQEIADREAWRTARLTFSRTPLSQVIQLFNSRTGSHLVLGEPSLASVEISGTLRADNAETLFRLLDLEFSIKSEERNGELVLSRR